MYKSLRSNINLLPAVAFFIIYLLWLFRAYYDVAYLDTIQFLAGNVNNMFNNDSTLQDFYYRPPFLYFLSTVLLYVNCKIFSYNSFIENIGSGVFLFFTALFFIKTNVSYFSGKTKIVFSLLASLVIFSLTKWEMSLWGGGFIHYVVMFFGFVCIDSAHKYYFNKDNNFSTQYFIIFYSILSVVSVMETTAFFLPFQLSLIILMTVNYFFLKEKIDIKRWRIAFGVTLCLLVFSFFINYLAELYSIQHPYEAYGKVNLSHSIGTALEKMQTDPAFVIKFYLIANSGNLIDHDAYAANSFARNILPFIGLVVLLCYAYALFLYIKYKKDEGTVAVNLILYTIIFYGIVMMGRLHFDDVFYGGSSRYTAATFSGVLGLGTFFLLILNEKKEDLKIQQLLNTLPLALIIICTLLVYRNQWQIAPYRKQTYQTMAENLKMNSNLESLMGYSNEVTGKARDMMVRNKLNVFKPQIKMANYAIDSELSAEGKYGFHELETSDDNSYRWTNGEGIIILPNLYTTSDTIKVMLKCYVPIEDTPTVILNDKFEPFLTKQVEGGYEYTFAFQEQKVFYKAVIKSRNFKPQELHKDSPDQRTLGLMFNSLKFINL